MKYAAIGNHNPEPAEVLQVSAGEVLTYERRKTTFPGWIWCTDAEGTQAWVPEAFVTIEGRSCRMSRDYVSRELAIEVSEIVDVIEIESAWAWVCNSEGTHGWVPIECLERLRPADVSG